MSISVSYHVNIDVGTTGETMTLDEIFSTYTKGSPGFVKAVETYCGFLISSTEIERIANKASDAAEFQRVFEDDDTWTDDNASANSGE